MRGPEEAATSRAFAVSTLATMAMLASECAELLKSCCVTAAVNVATRPLREARTA